MEKKGIVVHLRHHRFTHVRMFEYVVHPQVTQTHNHALPRPRAKTRTFPACCLQFMLRRKAPPLLCVVSPSLPLSLSLSLSLAQPRRRVRVPGSGVVLPSGPSKQCTHLDLSAAASTTPRPIPPERRRAAVPERGSLRGGERGSLGVGGRPTATECTRAALTEPSVSSLYSTVTCRRYTFALSLVCLSVLWWLTSVVDVCC